MPTETILKPTQNYWAFRSESKAEYSAGFGTIRILCKNILLFRLLGFWTRIWNNQNMDSAGFETIRISEVDSDFCLSEYSAFSAWFWSMFGGTISLIRSLLQTLENEARCKRKEKISPAAPIIGVFPYLRANLERGIGMEHVQILHDFLSNSKGSDQTSIFTITPMVNGRDAFRKSSQQRFTAASPCIFVIVLWISNITGLWKTLYVHLPS